MIAPCLPLVNGLSALCKSLLSTLLIPNSSKQIQKPIFKLPAGEFIRMVYEPCQSLVNHWQYFIQSLTDHWQPFSVDCQGEINTLTWIRWIEIYTLDSAWSMPWQLLNNPLTVPCQRPCQPTDLKEELIDKREESSCLFARDNQSLAFIL